MKNLYSLDKSCSLGTSYKQFNNSHINYIEINADDDGTLINLGDNSKIKWSDKNKSFYKEDQDGNITILSDINKEDWK